VPFNPTFAYSTHSSSNKHVESGRGRVGGEVGVAYHLLGGSQAQAHTQTCISIVGVSIFFVGDNKKLTGGEKRVDTLDLPL